MASISAVLGTDTLNAGRTKLNANDDAINTELGTVSTALTTHKSSSDHDGRYYTESEIDSQLSDIDLAVAAAQADADTAAADLTTHKSSSDHDSRYLRKDSPDDVVVKKASPKNELQHSDGTGILRISGNFADASGATVQLEHNASIAAGVTSYVPILKIFPGVAGILDTMLRDFYIRGKKAATEDFVLARIKNGFFALQAKIDVASVAASQTYEEYIPVPDNAILTQFMAMEDETQPLVEEALRIAFSRASGIMWAHVQVVTGAAAGGAVPVTYKIRGVGSDGGGYSYTEIVEVESPQDFTVGAANTWRFTLSFTI